MDYSPWLILFFFIILYRNMRGNFFYKKVGEQIITVRKSKNISQEQLALLSDIDRTYMARIEEGKANPSLRVIFKIAQTLKVPTEQLLKKRKTTLR